MWATHGMAEQTAERVKKQIPRRLESPRDDKNKGLRRGAEEALHQAEPSHENFSSREAMPFQNLANTTFSAS
jgi:hypothetical protein